METGTLIFISLISALAATMAVYHFRDIVLDIGDQLGLRQVDGVQVGSQEAIQTHGNGHSQALEPTHVPTIREPIPMLVPPLQVDEIYDLNDIVELLAVVRIRFPDGTIGQLPIDKLAILIGGRRENALTKAKELRGIVETPQQQPMILVDGKRLMAK